MGEAAASARLSDWFGTLGLSSFKRRLEEEWGARETADVCKLSEMDLAMAGMRASDRQKILSSRPQPTASAGIVAKKATEDQTSAKKAALEEAAAAKAAQVQAEATKVAVEEAAEAVEKAAQSAQKAAAKKAAEAEAAKKAAGQFRNLDINHDKQISKAEWLA